MEASLLICCCQIFIYTELNLDDIDNIDEDIFSLQQEIICHDNQLLRENINMNYNKNNFDLSY